MTLARFVTRTPTGRQWTLLPGAHTIALIAFFEIDHAPWPRNAFNVALLPFSLPTSSVIAG
jgi:hypothetical protein